MAFTFVVNWLTPFRQTKPHDAGCSPLELLPTELLSKILSFVAARRIPCSYKVLNHLPGDQNIKSLQVNLIACLLTSQRLHNVSLPIMYQDSKPTRFWKLSRVLESRPELGQLVRSLDISRFRATIPPASIRTCLSLMNRLRECRLMLEDLGEEEMLETIFSGMQHLEVLEIDTCYPAARDEWRIPDLIRDFFFDSPRSVGATITSLTCNLRDVPSSSMFEAMLPSMPKLRVLNVAHTDISYKALRSIPKTARLTHLDLTYCRNLSGADLTRFLVKHPAVNESLVILRASSVSCDGQLLAENEVAMILSHAPSTLRILNLGYSEMNRTHLPYLRNLASQLEELGVGRNLCLRDIEDIIMSRRYTFNAEDHNIDAWKLLEGEPRSESILGPMKDAAALYKLKQRLYSISRQTNRRSTHKNSNIKYLDISSMPPQEQGKIKESVLLAQQSIPLQIIKISEPRKDGYNMLSRLCSAVGWRDRCIDGRVWIERI